MKDALQEAKRLKEEAKTYLAMSRKTKDQKLTEEALEVLEEARTILKDELSELSGADKTNRLLQLRLLEIAAELADCFGIAGGAYRKINCLQEAIDMYDQGSEYEENPAYRIQNSYNMVNSIVLRVTNDSTTLNSLRSRIETTISVVRRQIDTSRERDWWAWADLGLLYVLGQKEEMAIESYRKINDLGAKVENVASIVDLLIKLQQHTKEPYPAIADLIGKCIFILNPAV